MLEIKNVLDPPKTYDEALAMRAKFIDRIDELQGMLASRSGMEWRNAVLADLRGNRSLLRQLKDWIRRNDAVKMSEWELLARAHQFLEEVSWHVGCGNALDAEREALLDAIELVVPGQYLNKQR